MKKTKLSRAKMGAKVLAAIQKYPGCKAVKEVNIAEIADTAANHMASKCNRIAEVSRSKRPDMLRGMLKKSFGNSLIC